MGDEGLLERAFENLVRNAREAAGEDGHVWIRLTEGEGTVSVVIADDGPGLPADEREQLRPFRSTKTGGLGLGLPIALKIVRLHRGELTLADRTPRGLEVTVFSNLLKGRELPCLKRDRVKITANINQLGFYTEPRLRRIKTNLDRYHDRICIGVNDGTRSSMSVATPATSGQAKLVPSAP